MFKKIILSSILLSGFNLYNLSAMEERPAPNPAFQLIEAGDFAGLQRLSKEQLCMHDPVTGDTPLRMALRKMLEDGNANFVIYLGKKHAIEEMLDDTLNFFKITEELISIAIRSGEGEHWNRLRDSFGRIYENDTIVDLLDKIQNLVERLYTNPSVGLALDIYTKHCKICHIFAEKLKNMAEQFTTQIDFARTPVRIPDSLKERLSKILGSQNFRPEQMNTFKDVLVTLEKIKTYIENGKWLAIATHSRVLRDFLY